MVEHVQREHFQREHFHHDRSFMQHACLPMTDLHYGKKTSTYNPDVFKDRMNRLLLALVEKQQEFKTPIDVLHITLLGDANDGSDIYATQPHHQAITNVEQQAEELSEFLCDWLLRLQVYYPNIDIETIPGNHGRSGKFSHEMANWDIVTYKYLNFKLKGRIKVNQHSPDDYNGFVRKVNWLGWNYLLYHGHEIKSWGGIPWYGILMRLSRWMLSSRLTPFDVALMGHFHTFGRWEFNKVTVLSGGTPISDDEWAFQSLGWESSTKWHFFGISEKAPITWQYGLELK